MSSTVIRDVRQTEHRRGRRAWVVALVPNALAVLFGSSYVWWPSSDVLAAGGTEGVLLLDRFTWGAFVMASGLAMALLLLTAYRQGEQ